METVTIDSASPPATASVRPIILSLGSKMLLLTSGLLVLSFALCGALTLSLARHLVRNGIAMKVSQESDFLAAASAGAFDQAGQANRGRLTALCEQLNKEAEILAVQILDVRRHVLAHSLTPDGTMSRFFVLQVPIRQGRAVLGFVRAWYSPVRALEDYWNTTGHLVLLLFFGTFALFSVVLFVVIERLLNRPFRQFMQALDDAPSRLHFATFDTRRQDEWGFLGKKLNRYLGFLSNLQERSSVLYETSRLLSAPSGIHDSLDAVFTGLLHRYRLSSCLLFVLEGDALIVEASAGVSTQFAKSLRVKPGEGLVGVTYASGAVRHLAEADDQDPVLGQLLERQPIGASVLVPMKADGRVVGTAVYLSQRSESFNEEQIASLSAFTDHISLAFRNGRRMGELQFSNQRLESELATTLRELHQTNSRLIRKVRELKTVYDLALATASSSNVGEVIQVMIRGVKELVEVQGAGFFLLGSAGSLEPVGPVFDRPSETGKSRVTNLEESPILQRVVREEKPQVINFVDASEPLPAAWKDIGIRSVLALPLRQGQDIKGLFCVINKVNGLFTEDDIRVLSLLTSRVAEVLHRLTLDDQLRQQFRDLKLLQDIAARLPSPPVLADTVATIGSIVRPALPGTDLCLFYLHQPDSEALVPAGGDWDPSLIFDLRALTVGVSEKSLPAEVFGSAEPRQIQSEIQDSGFPNDALLSIASFNELICLPLIVEQGTIGVMALGRREAPPLNIDQRRLAALLAKHVAIVVERSRLYERLRAANEKLEQINNLKNEFISMVSHELRTPLTTIKGFVSIVLNEETGPLNDQQRHFLNTSDRAIDRLTLLVSDLLDISRIEAGQIRMQLRSVSLKDVIHRVVGDFTPQYKAQGLTITLQEPEQLPNVLADPDRVIQVLDNLLSNALKYTKQGGVTITTADKGDFVMTAIRDTGSGIPKGEQEKIFEKFYQIKVGGGYPGKGTGLGLAIVRSIVESHRGKVWVDSESGKGAEFRFLLPRARTDGDSEQRRASVL
jgi:signal transduction histidine kinase